MSLCWDGCIPGAEGGGGGGGGVGEGLGGDYHPLPPLCAGMDGCLKMSRSALPCVSIRKGNSRTIQPIFMSDSSFDRLVLGTAK